MTRKGGSIAALALSLAVVIGGVARIYTAHITVHQGGTLAFLLIITVPLLIHASRPRPALSRGKMAEKTNITVISSATLAQVQRAQWRLNAKKYPRHAEELARVETQLRVIRRAA